MKRLLALLALLALCAGPVTADYLIVKVDLKKLTFGSGGAAGQNQQGFGQPGFGQPGAGQPGGGVGQPGAGQPGVGAKGGAPNKGGFPNKGGIPGKGAGAAMQAQPVQGNPNGGVGLPNGGPQGGPAGMAGPGMGQFGQGGQNTDSDAGSHIVYAIIELRGKMHPMQDGQGSGVMEIDHRYGRKGRFPITTDRVQYIYIPGDSVASTFKKRYGKDLNEGKDPGRLVYAADWALKHGLMKDFHNVMAALAKVEPKHPIYLAYQRVQAEIKTPLNADDPVTQDFINIVKSEGFRVVPSEAGHYALLTKLGGAQNEGVIKRRLGRYEEAYENFFYWFALQEGVSQPSTPKHRLYVVLVEDKAEFQRYYDGTQPTATDGFTPRRDNLIIMSAKRMDENFLVFEKNMQAMPAKFNRDDLITGAIWDRPEAKSNVMTISAIQTLTLMQKALEEESERATISHEAIRQLFSATGILPRFVNVPEWVRSGVASYFETPYGALYPGLGLPSWNHLVSWRHYWKENKVGGTANEALRRTISDRFFREAIAAQTDVREAANDKERERRDEKSKEAQDVARMTAWSLVYHLVDAKKFPQLLKYMEELNNLPRDLELNEQALQACFARAFNLGDARDPNRLDPIKTRAFADEWFSRTNDVHLEIAKAEEELPKLRFAPPRRPVSASGSGPLGFPGANPGGFPNANPNAPGLPNANPNANPNGVLNPNPGAPGALNPRP